MSGIISIFLNYSGDQEVLFNFDVISKKLSPSSKGSSLDPGQAKATWQKEAM